MIYDLNEINNDPFKDKTFDICIIGAGAAGITLAIYLKKNFNILLLEGGGFEFSNESQEIYKGKNVGHEYFELDTSRARWLGGTTNWWGGWCAPFEKCDFKKRDFVKYSGWPIEKTDLDPYDKEARFIVNLPKNPQSINYKGWNDILEKGDKDLNKFKFRWSSPATNFRDKYKSELENRENITCYVNANLTDMTLSDDLSSIKNIEIKNYRSKVFSAKAKIYILATGGIENARLLLNFNKQCKNGIGNNNDLVGRFFSDHPHFVTGSFIVDDNITKVFASKKPEWSDEFRTTLFRPSEKFQEQQKVLNFGLRVEPSLELYSSILTFKEKIRHILCSTDWSRDMLGNRCHNDGAIRVVAEQTPNPESRVTIGSEVDKFGLKQVVLNWRLQEMDQSTFRKATMRFAKLFVERNLGRMKIDDWILSRDTQFPGFPQEVGGNHHMGTTRMGATPYEGVVDKNQKVFGIDNLYIAGSSVFATTGHVNPTFTIIQMTLRLADHINTTYSTA